MTTANAGDAVGAIIKWWRELIPDPGEGKGDRAAAAQLRRCGTLMEALMIRQTHHLLQTVHRLGVKDDNSVILLAILLAHVERVGGVPQPFARLAGKTKGDAAEGPQRVSPQRFGVLLKALEDRDQEAAIRTLRRAFLILRKDPIDVRKFVGDVLFFTARTQRNWNYDYWQTSTEDDAAAPADQSPTV
jgi:CRISPR type I-E-associated protein CasB/Cse2